MESLFGVPVERLALGAGLASVAIVLGLLGVVLRRPVLWRLGLRNVPRRPGSSLLVVAGLALGTAVVTSALFTGDTMTYTVRSLVADSLGRVDEVVVQSWLGPRGQNRRWFEAVAKGAPLTAGSGYFDVAIHDRLAAELADGPVAALVPAIVEQATVVDRTTQQLLPDTNVLGLPPDFPPAMGALTGPDGAALSLAGLAPDELLVNQEAAAQLGATLGDRLQARFGERTVELRLAGIYATGDLGGARPTVVLPLGTLQAHLDHGGQINQILVVNRGDRADSVRLSGEAARLLRARLVDEAAATRAVEALRREPVRRGLAALAADLRGPDAERLARVRDALAAPDAEARAQVVDAIGDPETAARLGLVALRLPQGAERRELFGALNAAGGVRVLELKRVAQERADQYASILTSIFVVLGVFSIATGLMLVFLVFVLMAAGRRAEMGVARALGARQRDLTAMLLVEGLGYALGAALVGVAAGLGIGHALVAVLQTALTPLGLSVRPHVEPRSLAFAFALGLLLSLLTIGLSAWWTSRLNIAAAMRNLAEPTGRAAVWLRPLLAVGLMAVGLGLLTLGQRGQLLLPLALGLSALVLAVERLLAWAVGDRGWGSGGRGRRAPVRALLATLASLLLLALWWEPGRVVQALGLGRAPLAPEVFPVAGIAMALAAVWGLSANLGWLLAAATWLVRPLRLTGRLAAAHLGQHTFRAGMAMAMFALVLCSLTVSSVLLAGAHRAYGRPDGDNAGYDLRAQTDGAAPAAGESVPVVFDLRAALTDAPAARPDDFPAIGGVATQSGELIRLAGPRATWQPASVSVLDDAFLRATEAHLMTRAAGYGEGRDVWTALADQPGLAVVGPSVAAALGLGPAGDALPPDTTVWARARGGGRAVRLTVVGVLAPRSPLGDGVFLSAATAARAGLPSARQVTYYLRTRDGLTPERAASALNVSFGDRGLRASVVDPELRLSQAVQAPLRFLLQGFMGLGLVSGVLAVGLLSARAVLERRAQIGMLRAVGMRAGAVQFSLLLEGSAVALAGAGVGLGVGLVLAGQVVRYLQRAHPEFPLVVPADQLVAIAMLAWGASLLAAAVPAWRAGRITPVEALRYE
ncbi:MAG TPA: FtsX-like permease family protein [Chloroflexota bacterium]|nr:FtsX-like permease family protein [Chloroflexota bacterium]